MRTKMANADKADNAIFRLFTNGYKSGLKSFANDLPRNCRAFPSRQIFIPLRKPGINSGISILITRHGRIIHWTSCSRKLGNHDRSICGSEQRRCDGQTLKRPNSWSTSTFGYGAFLQSLTGTKATGGRRWNGSSTATESSRTGEAASSTTPTAGFDDPRDLIAAIRRIVHVSGETVRIVEELPEPITIGLAAK